MIRPELMEPGKSYADVRLPDGNYYGAPFKDCHFENDIVSILFEDNVIISTHMSNVVMYSKKEE